MNRCESYKICSTFFLHLTFKEKFSQGQILFICEHSRNLNIKYYLCFNECEKIIKTFQIYWKIETFYKLSKKTRAI